MLIKSVKEREVRPILFNTLGQNVWLLPFQQLGRNPFLNEEFYQLGIDMQIYANNNSWGLLRQGFGLNRITSLLGQFSWVEKAIANGIFILVRTAVDCGSVLDVSIYNSLNLAAIKTADSLAVGTQVCLWSQGIRKPESFFFFFSVCF